MAMSGRRGCPLVLLCLLAAAVVAEESAEEAEHADDEAFEGEEEDSEGHPMEDPDHSMEDPTSELPPLTTDQLRKLHEKVDKNRDGKVGLDELMSFSAGLSGPMAIKYVTDAGLVQIADKSKDGKVSLEEHMADFNGHFDEDDLPTPQQVEERKQLEVKRFKAADGNEDGFLDGHEVVGFFRPETNERVMTVAIETTMKQKDLNGDGKLTINELWAPEDDTADVKNDPAFLDMRSDFKLLDKNGDGYIDTSELRKWESGEHVTEGAMRTLLGIADANDDGELTSEELTEAAEPLSESDAQYHLASWSTHHEF